MFNLVDSLASGLVAIVTVAAGADQALAKLGKIVDFLSLHIGTRTAAGEFQKQQAGGANFDGMDSFMALGPTLKRGARSLAAARGVAVPKSNTGQKKSGAVTFADSGKHTTKQKQIEAGRKRPTGGGGGGSVGGRSQRLNADPGDAATLPRALKGLTASAR